MGGIKNRNSGKEVELDDGKLRTIAVKSEQLADDTDMANVLSHLIDSRYAEIADVEQSSNADELSKKEQIRQQQERIAESVFGNSSSSSSKQKASLDSYDRHSATGSTEHVESSDEEDLSENDKDEVSKIQEDLAERIFSS